MLQSALRKISVQNIHEVPALGSFFANSFLCHHNKRIVNVRQDHVIIILIPLPGLPNAIDQQIKAIRYVLGELS